MGLPVLAVKVPRLPANTRKSTFPSIPIPAFSQQAGQGVLLVPQIEARHNGLISCHSHTYTSQCSRYGGVSFSASVVAC